MLELVSKFSNMKKTQLFLFDVMFSVCWFGMDFLWFLSSMCERLESDYNVLSWFVGLFLGLGITLAIVGLFAVIILNSPKSVGNDLANHLWFLMNLNWFIFDVSGMKFFIFSTIFLFVLNTIALAKHFHESAIENGLLPNILKRVK